MVEKVALSTEYDDARTEEASRVPRIEAWLPPGGRVEPSIRRVSRAETPCSHDAVPVRVHALGVGDVVPRLEILVACCRSDATNRSTCVTTAQGIFLLKGGEIFALSRNRDHGTTCGRTHSAGGDGERAAKGGNRRIPFPTAWHADLLNAGPAPDNTLDARTAHIHPGSPTSSLDNGQDRPGRLIPSPKQRGAKFAFWVGWPTYCRLTARSRQAVR